MERAVLRKSRLNVSYPGWSFRMWMSASNKNPPSHSHPRAVRALAIFGNGSLLRSIAFRANGTALRRSTL